MAQFWFQRGMAYLPLTLIIWTYITFITSYIWSVLRGDVDALFPYISDTGARRPESCLFGQMLNITACISFATLYVRYAQVSGYIDDIRIENSYLVDKLNKAGLFLAFIICLGMSLVANFQETSVLQVHVIGAFMTFGGGTIYEIIQCIITNKMHPEINGRGVFIARLVIACFSAIFFISVSVTSGLLKTFISDEIVHVHWKPTDPGYQVHLVSTFSEWLLAASFLSFFFTYIKEFQLIDLSVNPRLFRSTLHRSSSSIMPITADEDQ